MRILRLGICLFVSAACSGAGAFVQIETVRKWFRNPQSYSKLNQYQARDMACQTGLLDEVIARLYHPDALQRITALRVLTDVQSHFSVSKRSLGASIEAPSDVLLDKVADVLPEIFRRALDRPRSPEVQALIGLLSASLDFDMIDFLAPELLAVLQAIPEPSPLVDSIFVLFAWTYSLEVNDTLPFEVWEAYQKRPPQSVSPLVQEVMRQAVRSPEPRLLACRDIWPGSTRTLH